MSILDIHINKKGKKMKDLPIREVATFYGIYTCFKKPLEAMKSQNMEDWFKKNKIKCKSIARFKNLFSQCNSIFHIKRKGNYKVPHFFSHMSISLPRYRQIDKIDNNTLRLKLSKFFVALKKKNINDLGIIIFNEIVEVVSGKKTKSEINGYGQEEFVPWVPEAIM
jgi:hypothetical protein